MNIEVLLLSKMLSIKNIDWKEIFRSFELVWKYGIVDFLVILEKIFDDGMLIEMIFFEESRCSFIVCLNLLICFKFFWVVLVVLVDLYLRNINFLIIKVFDVIFLFYGICLV